MWDITYKVKFLVVVNLVDATTILVSLQYSSCRLVALWIAVSASCEPMCEALQFLRH